MPAPVAARPVRLAPPIPKGMDFARVAIAKAVHSNQDESESAANYAATRWGADSQAAISIKSAVSAGARSDGLLSVPTAATEFMSAVFEASAIGQLALRRRPPKTRYL